jgi:hypothetical protein
MDLAVLEAVDLALYISDLSCAAVDSDSCKDMGGSGGAETLTFGVTMGTRYFIVVDTYTALGSDYVLTLSQGS